MRYIKKRDKGSIFFWNLLVNVRDNIQWSATTDASAIGTLPLIVSDHIIKSKSGSLVDPYCVDSWINWFKS